MAFPQRPIPSTTWNLDPPTSTRPAEAEFFNSSGFQKEPKSVIEENNIDVESLQNAELHHSLVKIESRFENKKTGYSIWKTGNGWLIRPDLIITSGDVVFDVEYQLGAATQVKCYIGNQGLTSVENVQAQLHYGQRIITSAEWVAGSDARSRDIAFIQIAKPIAIALSTYNSEPEPVTVPTLEIETVAPLVPEIVEKLTHCAGCCGACSNSVAPSVEQIQEQKPETQPEDTSVVIPLAPSIITEPEADGFVSISTGENTPTSSTEGEDAEQDPFYEALMTVSKIDTDSLDIQSPLLGSVGQFVSIVGGSLLRYVVGAETISSGQSTKISGAAERALLAEASLQAVLAIEESPELDEIVDSMRANWTANAPKIDEVAGLLAPYLAEPALDITTFHEEDILEQTASSKKHKRRALGIRHFPGSGINGTGNDFIKGLFAPTLPLAGREDVFSSVGPVLRSAVMAVEQLVSTTGQTQVAERVPKLLLKVASTAGATAVVASADEEATRVLLQRALIADAALQALSVLPQEKLKLLKLIPLDSGFIQVEDIFDFLKMVLQKLGATALLPSKHAVKKFAVLLNDAPAKPQLKAQPIETISVKASSNKFALRDRLRGNKTAA